MKMAYAASVAVRAGVKYDSEVPLRVAVKSAMKFGNSYSRTAGKSCGATNVLQANVSELLSNSYSCTLV